MAWVLACVFGEWCPFASRVCFLSIVLRVIVPESAPIHLTYVDFEFILAMVLEWRSKEGG